jgi:phospholysine phosphohistidine inorganic pyrophosphate phosphatase
MRAILFDLDGVLYVGDQPIVGAAAAMARVRATGIPHLFLTNTSSRPRRSLAERLGSMGLDIPALDIVTPALAAVDWLKAHNLYQAALFVRPATREDFSGIEPLSDAAQVGADAVVVGDLGEGWDFATLNRAFRLLMNEPHPPLVALGMTRYWRASDGLRLDTGAFVAALREASGIEPVVLGKPAAPFFSAALAMLGVPAGDCLMVGDDIRSDIGGAQAAGIAGLLVRTGKFRAEDLDGEIAPLAVLDSIADLPDWIECHFD